MSVSTEFKRDRAWVEVDLGNLLANARTVQRAALDATLLPMVKADAYGLGAVRVARTLESLSPWGFGVATIDEGAELRNAGIDRPIVMFTPASALQLERCRDYGLRPVLDDPSLLSQWNRPYHCEVDTGMGRAGIRWDDAESLRGLADNPPEGVFTHLHSADTSSESVDVQLERFERVLSGLRERPALVHVANSAGSWRVSQRFDLVRPGIFLYGGRAGIDLPAPAPVVSLRARVVAVRRIAAGDTVSYGAEWTAPAPTTVGTLAIGYADGVLRSTQRGGEVLRCGHRHPVVGRVTMDMTMVDLGSAGDGEPQVGDVATLIGSDGDDEITVDDFAEWAGTISYEILTGLGARLPRVYSGP